MVVVVVASICEPDHGFRKNRNFQWWVDLESLLYNVVSSKLVVTDLLYEEEPQSKK
jgi:hypothetical protein